MDREPGNRNITETIETNMADIQSALLYGPSNARRESLDTTLQRLSRMAYGFHSPMPLIAFAMLEHGGP